jgi:hypothetical protein
MRINRRFLYAGVFLVALGAVLVAADLGTLDLAIVRDALRLWPVAVVLVGVAIVVRRSPIALPAGLLAATVPGLVLGGAVAIGPRFVTDCASPGPSVPAATRDGAFGDPRNVTIRARCGVLRLRSGADQAGWTLTTGAGTAPAPAVDARADSVAIDAVGSSTAFGWPSSDGAPSTWDLVVPTGDLGDVSATLNATDSTLDLATTRVHSLAVTSSASRVVVDLSSTYVSDISTVTNLGQLTLFLPTGSDPTVKVTMNGGEVRICTPTADLASEGVRVTGRVFAGHIDVRGRRETDTTIDYESQGYALAPHRADIRVTGSFGSIEIDPIGGCSK